MRTLFYLGLLTAIGICGVWVYLQDGQMALTWGGLIYEMSLRAFVGISFIFLTGLAFLIWTIRFLLCLPSIFKARLRENRYQKGQIYLRLCLENFLFEDDKALIKSLKTAEKYLSHQELRVIHAYIKGVSLLRAGNSPEAISIFESLKEESVGRRLGLKGLIQAALQGNRFQVALKHLEQLEREFPSKWGLRTQYDIFIELKYYDKALSLLPRLADLGAVENRYIAAGNLIYQKVQQAIKENQDIDLVEELQKSHKLDPANADCALDLAKALYHQKKYKEGSRVIEKTWVFTPRLELARLYGKMIPESTPLRAVQRVGVLRLLGTDEIRESSEAILAYIEACLNAKMWGEAREQLNTFLKNHEEWPKSSRALLVSYLKERLTVEELEVPVDNLAAKHQSWLKTYINAEV